MGTVPSRAQGSLAIRIRITAISASGIPRFEAMEGAENCDAGTTAGSQSDVTGAVAQPRVGEIKRNAPKAKAFK